MTWSQVFFIAKILALTVVVNYAFRITLWLMS